MWLRHYTLKISYYNNKFQLEPSKFIINNGNIEVSANFNFNKIFKGNLNVKNFEINVINSFLKDKIPLSGILNGTLLGNTIDNKINIEGKIDISNGKYENFLFEDWEYLSLL